ncbi:hypothetical protein [Acidiferrobacter sp. SPIII_3]|uniref:hypothetical protein n=1 Tax=Acidiferrobacter sp. SPIII_3 TaxID=1281578 RepID=UPI003519FF8C
MSGLLVGIIVSRALSGFGAFLGWRIIYAIAAGAMAVCAIAASCPVSRRPSRPPTGPCSDP